MILQPMIRNNICLNAHPLGCTHLVQQQIDYVHQRALQPNAFNKRLSNVLVIGASAGYGLASRIVAAFGARASTLGVAFEKEGSAKRPATPGWYCTKKFEAEAHRAGLQAETIIGDAFSNDTRQQSIEIIKSRYAPIDLVIYSIASGVRTDPTDGTTYRSALKPIGAAYEARSLDPMAGTLHTTRVEAASDEEIAATVKVMGGEDWLLWSEALIESNVLAPGALNIAFSYLGPEVTTPIYRNGTIGRAKEHLESTARTITERMRALNGRAYVSINKAVVTRASAVIPVVPLYLALLFQIMKQKGLHEDCIEQIYRLFSERLYRLDEPHTVPTDKQGRIRIDDWEMREDVQHEVEELWGRVTDTTILDISDLQGYRENFLNIHGFGFKHIDYQAETTL